MRVLEQVLSPGMQHAEEANLRAKVIGIGGHFKHRFRTDAK